jgi:hypothetical protein
VKKVDDVLYHQLPTKMNKMKETALLIWMKGDGTPHPGDQAAPHTEKLNKVQSLVRSGSSRNK